MARRGGEDEGRAPATPAATTIRTLISAPGASFPLVALALSLLVAGFALWSYPRIESVVRRQVGDVLVATRDASVAAVTLWLEGAKRAAYLTLQDYRLKATLDTCLTEGGRCDSGEVAGMLWPYVQAGGFARFLVADRSGRVRAGDPSKSGPDYVPAQVQSDAERLVGAGVGMLPSQLEAERAMLCVGVPILVGAEGTRLGTLLLGLPLEGLTSVLNVARPGLTGETYAFDHEGRFLSQSRFLPQLRKAGLVGPTADGTVLTVDLRDPGVDLTRGQRASRPRREQPLTRMAREAVAGRSGVDVDGYRDYRGVPVVGAWRWLASLGIGIAAEVDVSEAYLAPSTVRSIFLSLLGALVVASLTLLLAAALTARLRGRVRLAQSIAAEFGQYRTVRKLGEGGMGAVYLASHQMLKRPAAIKLLRRDRTSLEALSRFEREVQITSKLVHPNTVAVYDYGRSEDGTPYYVMEYVEGLDLQRLVERFGPLPSERVIHLLRQVCGSLAEAHAAGLVHRDIKPANLIVCGKGGATDTLKVLDFGIVKLLKGERLGTESKLLLGTPEYMAPEMFESATQASAQTDLYAVGCVAFFLLTATLVFDADSPAGLCMAHLTLAPELPSARLGAKVDQDLEAAVVACLAKRREARPQNAAALKALIDRSPLAYAWTEARADAWWSTRAREIDELQVESRESALDAPLTIRRRPSDVAGAGIQAR